MRPAGAAALAVQWLGREQSYQALGREIVWTTVRAAGGGQHDLQWLSPLVEAELEERLDVRGDTARPTTPSAATRSSFAMLIRSPLPTALSGDSPGNARKRKATLTAVEARLLGRAAPSRGRRPSPAKALLELARSVVVGTVDARRTA